MDNKMTALNEMELENVNGGFISLCAALAITFAAPFVSAGVVAAGAWIGNMIKDAVNS